MKTDADVLRAALTVYKELNFLEAKGFTITACYKELAERYSIQYPWDLKSEAEVDDFVANRIDANSIKSRAG